MSKLIPLDVHEAALAQRDASLDCLRRVLAYVTRVGGFMKAEHQALMRGARAFVVECEQSKEGK